MPEDDLVAHWHSVTSGVTRAERRIDRLLEDSGVPAQWFAVLHLLLGAPEHRLPMNALAREVAMTSGGFTKLADRMAREGLIDRRGSVSDRRVVNATLTGDGLLMAQRAIRVYRDALRACVLGIVTADELASAAATMRALSAAHAASVEVEDAAEVIATKRGPALPDRRGRGHSSDEAVRRSVPPYPTR